MDSSIQIFENQEFGKLRVITDEDGELWFVAKDVCDALGLSNVTEALKALDDDEKNTLRISEGIQGNPNRAVISEPGLYKLVLRSRKQEAKQFQRWVTHKVIPSIRKHGMYATPEIIAKALQDPKAMVQVFTALAEEQSKNRALQERNGMLETKAGFYDSAMDAKRGYSITEVARYMHQIDKTMKRKRLFTLLEADGIITRDHQASQYGDTRGYVFNYLPPTYIDPNTMEKKQPKAYAKVTQKGLGWMVDRYCKAQVKLEAEDEVA